MGNFNVSLGKSSQFNVEQKSKSSSKSTSLWNGRNIAIASTAVALGVLAYVYRGSIFGVAAPLLKQASSNEILKNATDSLSSTLTENVTEAVSASVSGVKKYSKKDVISEMVSVAKIKDNMFDLKHRIELIRSFHEACLENTEDSATACGYVDSLLSSMCSRTQSYVTQYAKNGHIYSITREFAELSSINDICNKAGV